MTETKRPSRTRLAASPADLDTFGTRVLRELLRMRRQDEGEQAPIVDGKPHERKAA